MPLCVVLLQRGACGGYAMCACVHYYNVALDMPSLMRHLIIESQPSVHQMLHRLLCRLSHPGSSHVYINVNNLFTLHSSASISRPVCPRATARHPEMPPRAPLLASATWVRSAICVAVETCHVLRPLESQTRRMPIRISAYNDARR